MEEVQNWRPDERGTPWSWLVPLTEMAGFGGAGEWYSTSPRNENPVNENHLGICLSFSQKNRN